MIGLDQPAAGSFALGASLAGVGLVFAGVAAVAAQVSQTSSSMYGITGAVLGAAYLLRAAGDVGDGTLSWLSPIGWGQAMRPYAGERWWPLALMLVATAGLVWAAIALRAHRDEGAGIIAQRPGPASAHPRLLSPLGLAIRLQRGVIAGWSAGLFLSGVSLGLTGNDADSLLGDSDEIEQLLGMGAGDIVDQYFAVTMLTMALVGTGFGIQVALRMRSEETSGQARAAARDRALARALGGRLRRGRDGRLAARAGRQRARRRDRRRAQQQRRGAGPAAAARGRRPGARGVGGGRRGGGAVRVRAARGGRGLGRARRLRAADRARPAARPARTGCSTSRRSSTCRSSRPRSSAPRRCSPSQRSPRR